MLKRFLLLLPALVALLPLGACSADAALEPEPTIDTKGAFLAVAADEGGYQLFRTLAILGSGEPDDAFFVVPYVEQAESFEEARQLAQDPALARKPLTFIGRSYITSRDWRAVWFRSVSTAEEAEFR